MEQALCPASLLTADLDGFASRDCVSVSAWRGDAVNALLRVDHQQVFAAPGRELARLDPLGFLTFDDDLLGFLPPLCWFSASPGSSTGPLRCPGSRQS